MKKKSFILFALLLCALTASAQDYHKAGFRGVVEKAQSQLGYSSYNTWFDEEGFLGGIALETPGGVIEVKNIEYTESGFYGTMNGNSVNMTVSKGRITRASYSENDANYVLTYTYGPNGFLSEVTQVKTWYEEVEIVRSASLSVNTHGYEYYMKKAKAALSRLDMSGYYRYSAQALKAAEKASVDYNPGSVKTRREKRTNTTSASFDDYNTDNYGNWTSRRKEERNENAKNAITTERQTITYNSRFISKVKWEKQVLPQGSMEAIEEFANDRTTDPEYKEIACKEWNRMFATVGELSEESALYYASKSIISPENREALYAPIRNSITTNLLPQQTNYRHVNDILARYDKYEGLVDNDLRRNITSYSNKLRDEEIASLNNMASNALANNEFTSAHNYAAKVLNIDAYNYPAQKLLADSHYRLVKAKEANKTVSDRDYSDFLAENPNSSYAQEMKNNRATLAMASFNKYTSIDEMKRVLKYGADDATNARIHKKIRRQETKFHHEFYDGGILYAGIVTSYSIGCFSSFWSNGIGLRLGWAKHLLNLYAGVEYQNVRFTKRLYDSQAPNVSYKDTASTRLSGDRLVIPVDLRINLSRAPRFNFYVFGGIYYNIIMKGKYNIGSHDEPDWIKDKNVLTNGTITPRFGLGFNLRMVEFELYAAMERNKLYDKNYIDGLNIGNRYTQEIIDRQVKNNLRYGLSFRVLFGKNPED